VGIGDGYPARRPITTRSSRYDDEGLTFYLDISIMIYIGQGRWSTQLVTNDAAMRRTSTVNALRRLFTRQPRVSGSRFDRYYSGVLRSGTGYPTADEARRDLISYDRTSMPYGWPH
jgi:hypothetical protein